MPQFLKDHGVRLVELGYTVLPIQPGTKRPDIRDWPNVAATADDVVKWYSNGRAQHGAGINARDTPAVDVDVMDVGVAQQMSDAIDQIFPGIALMTRTGLAPKFLIPFRSETPFRKITSNVYTDGINDHKVEILGDGQQWVAYHIHPETGNPYVWFNGVDDAGITVVPHAALPSLREYDAQLVVDAFECIAAKMVANGRWKKRELGTRPERHSILGKDDDPFASQAVGKTSSEVVTLLTYHKNTDSDYDHWFAVLAAVQHELGDEGRDAAYDWSSSSAKHTDEKFNTTWNSLGRYTGRQITLRSLLKGHAAPNNGPTVSDLAFKFYSGDDYAVDFAAAPEIIEDVLPDRGIVMVYGPSGKGKTFWTLDLAFHVHNGIKWRDKDVAGGDVMYVAAEAGRGIKKRIQAVKRRNPEWRSPFVADIAPDLASTVSLEAVRDAALAVGKPAIVIIDTMSASFEGDDSSQQDIAKMMRNLKTLSDALECLIIFVHHTTKDGGSYRGSGVLFANVDAVLELVSEGEGAERKQWITQRKHREGEDGRSYPFALRISEPLAFKPNGKPITSCTIEQEDYSPAPRKEGRKPRSGDFETSHNYEKARHFLHVIQDMCGLEIGLNLQEDEVIEAIQKDKIVNPMEEPDYPLKKNIVPTLRTLANLGKITKEGRNIRIC